MSAARPAALDFHVRRDRFGETRWVEGPPPGDPSAGQALFRIDRFAFTANNVTYAAAGELLRYWDFFPAGEEGWGRIPTMGYADVIASAHPEVAEGTRCFGFYPMSRYLVLEPAEATPARIVDGAAHRQGLAAAYNTYTPVEHDLAWAPEHEDRTLLLRGLFLTSYLIDDMLAESGDHGATQVVVGSASSKTAVALAWLLERAGRVRVVGVTSPRNAAFVKGLGYYDEVVLYEDVESIARAPSVLVDMSGHGEMVSRLHRHLGEQMKYSSIVGATHWDAPPRARDLPGATPELFFAPARMQRLSPARLEGAWSGFRDASEAWLEVVRHSGRGAVERVYRDTLAGRTSPAQGNILSLRT